MDEPKKKTVKSVENAGEKFFSKNGEWSLPGDPREGAPVTLAQLLALKSGLPDSVVQAVPGTSEDVIRTLFEFVEKEQRDHLEIRELRVGTEHVSEERFNHDRGVWNKKIAVKHLWYRRDDGKPKDVYPACVVDRDASDYAGSIIRFQWRDRSKKAPTGRLLKGSRAGKMSRTKNSTASDPAPVSGQETRSGFHNLRFELTAFVGRTREEESLRSLLATERLVTLTGVGGAGKTRLANEIGLNIIQSHPDGVRFIELAPVADAHAVARTVASGLGLPTQHAAESLFEVAAASYEQRSVLLIFDNCEHLQKECARIVERLLHACPSMRVLATSRMRLNIDGERVFPLSTLSLPDETDSFNPTELKK